MTNVTLSKLKDELDKQRQQFVLELETRSNILKDELIKRFDETRSDLQASLQKATEDAAAAKKMAAENSDEIVRLRSTVESLVSINKHQAAAIADLTERVEERTNRQLRNTLVFKGVPEPSHEKSWEDTKTVLAEAVHSSFPNLPVSQARSFFERAHRSKSEGFKNGKQGKRDIFVKLFDWNICEKLKSDFRKARMQNNGPNISCDQKYGPLTTFRRNHALNVRRDLKQRGEIVSGFISYPAKLMVRKTNSKTERYSEYDDYSKMEVIFPTV